MHRSLAPFLASLFALCVQTTIACTGATGVSPGPAGSETEAKLTPPGPAESGKTAPAAPSEDTRRAPGDTAGTTAPSTTPAAAGPSSADASDSNTPPRAAEKIRGIYLQANTAQSPKRLQKLIENSVEVGVNTLVVDLWRSPTPNYKKGVQRIQEAGLHYVPRITMFPDGGTHAQISSRAYWEERYKLVEHAIALGAKDIQLDYIRYSSKNRASPENALNVREVLRFFKKRVNERGGRLQIDVFGEVAFGPSLHIGQDMALFAHEIDAVCPMVYPSHYQPYKERALIPYETVYESLTALKRQMGQKQVPVFAYIELFNHRHRMDTEERINYIRAELRAVREAQVEGWMAWSAGNHYDILFDVLRRYKGEG